MGRNRYIVIQDWMLELGLSSAELLAFALIWGFCQDGESDYHGSVTYVAEWCGMTRPAASAVLKKLTESGIIEREEEVGYPAHYRIAPDLGCNETLQGGVKKLYRGCKETLHDNDTKVSKNIKINKNTLTSREEDQKESYGDKVRMTRTEYAKLVSQYGSADADRLCQILDDYLVCHPRKQYASHYRAILSWCVNRLNDEKLMARRLQNAEEASQRMSGKQVNQVSGYGEALRDANRRLAEIDAKYNSKK